MIISIEVTEHANGFRRFEVTQSDKSSGELTFEEMLGLVAALTIPEKRRCLAWMRNKDQQREMDERLRAMRCEGDE